jgi:hypothetical protein
MSADAGQVFTEEMCASLRLEEDPCDDHVNEVPHEPHGILFDEPEGIYVCPGIEPRSNDVTPFDLHEDQWREEMHEGLRDERGRWIGED